MLILHRGKCGDLIALCAWLKQKHQEQKVRLYIKPWSGFGKSQLDWIAPLLYEQGRFQKIEVCQKLSVVEPVKDIPCDLQEARKAAAQGVYTGQYVMSGRWWMQTGIQRRNIDLRDRFSLWYEGSPVASIQPWLKVPESQPTIKEPYVVINTNSAYGCFQDLSPLAELTGYKIFFTGDKKDYEKHAAYSQYFDVKSSIQLAQLIRNCSLFIGTQSLPFWLAQSQAVPRILCVSPYFRDTQIRAVGNFAAPVCDKQQLKIALAYWKPVELHYTQSTASKGFIISTQGTPAYIDLQLKLHKQQWNHDCIVVDDGSHDQRLKQVCSKWNVPLLGVDDQPLGHHPGDFKAYQLGIPYFKGKQWVIKISRRCVWRADLSLTLQDYKDAKVLSAWQRGQNNTMSSNCIAYHISQLPQECIQDFLSQVPAQDLLHHVENLHFQVFSKYFNPPFTHWKQVLLGQGMSLTTPNCLWHRQVGPWLYFSLSKQLGLQWSLQDFMI